MNDDLINFIATNYTKYLPNSLLIAQAFILKYNEYGREFGLPAVNKAIEDGISANLYSNKNRVKKYKVQSGLKTEKLKHTYEKKVSEYPKSSDSEIF